MDKLIWAFKPIKELNDETGFVSCDSELAEKLIKAGKVQDPIIGADHLKHVESDSKTTKVVKDAQKTTKSAEDKKPKKKASTKASK